MITLERLETLLAGFKDRTIGLLGDLFLDRYLDLDPELRKLSIETGLEAYQITRVRNYPGALGTVMNNLAALGVGRLVPVAVLGDDGQAFDLVKAWPLAGRHHAPAARCRATDADLYQADAAAGRRRLA